METHQIMEFLSSLHVFRRAERSVLTCIAREPTIETFSKDWEILQEGEAPGDVGYVILDGAVDVVIEGEKVATLRKGHVFGEYSPVFNRQRTASVIVRSEVRCLVLSKRMLLRLIASGSGLNSVMLHRIHQNRKHQRGCFRDL